MTNENYTSKIEVSCEMANNVSNLETLINLDCITLDDEDRENLESIKSLYSRTLLKEFKSTVIKVIALEKFYHEFHKDLD